MVKNKWDSTPWMESEDRIVFYKESSTKIKGIFLDRDICVEIRKEEYILTLKYKLNGEIVKIVEIPLSYQEFRWGSMTGRADELEQDENFLEESEW